MTDKSANNRDRESRRNDSLQSSERDPALGEDARAFGAGGQVTQRAFEPGHEDAKDRDPARDESLPGLEQSGQRNR